MAQNKHVTLDDSKGITLFINRGSNYAPKCTTGFRGNYYNAHHVVPCTAIQRSLATFLGKKPPEYNKALARFTNWDVNAGANLLGLPHRLAYELAYQASPTSNLNVQPTWMMAATAVLGKASPKYPIHLPTNWGHIEYNKQVESKLDPIWKRLTVKTKKHEPVSATDMGGEIQAVSDAYRAKLEAKVGQTKKDWLNGTNVAQFRMD